VTNEHLLKKQLVQMPNYEHTKSLVILTNNVTFFSILTSC